MADKIVKFIVFHIVCCGALILILVFGLGGLSIFYGITQNKFFFIGIGLILLAIIFWLIKRHDWKPINKK